MTVTHKPTTRKTVRKTAGTQRLVVRATPEEKYLLQRAAERAGQSLARFVLQSALRDSLAFAQAILNDEPAGSALHQMAERYRAFMDGS